MFRLLLFALILSSTCAGSPGGTSVPLLFVANHGQAPASVRYMGQGLNLTAYFSQRKILFRLGDDAIRMELPGSNRSALVEGIHPLPGVATSYEAKETGGWESDLWRRSIRPDLSRHRHDLHRQRSQPEVRVHRCSRR